MKSMCLLAMMMVLLTVSAAQAFEAAGLITPFQVVHVGSPQVGVLSTVNFERGDTVSQGQVIATLHSNVEKAAMELKMAHMEFSQRKKERLNPLFKQDVITANDMDEAETERALAAADYRYSAEIVKRLEIRSSIDGVVVERYMAPGEYVENRPILKLAQIDPLCVEVILPSEMYQTVKVGMTAQVQPEAPIGGSHEAQVTIVDRVIDAASGTFGVRLTMPNPEKSLPAGLKCTVIFDVQDKSEAKY
jgi:membrane fusion protein, multidrug efflux system